LAGALAAVKLHVPVAHVEAGLRSFNREMPEEHNRVLTDHCAEMLFCPTQTAVNHLASEGITRNVYLVGDTMYDAVLQFSELARQRSTILQDLGVEPKRYLLATVHRPYNTDNRENLQSILAALVESGETVIFPVHPRTRARIAETDALSFLTKADNVRMIPPLGYLDMLMLEQHARIILTDSGGIQKEAYFFAVPCVTLRPETEWVETVTTGWNRLAWHNTNNILAAIHATWHTESPPSIFGDGDASEKIVHFLKTHMEPV
jgi:UDP-N-acetylglucosamine 2-epimerase